MRRILRKAAVGHTFNQVSVSILVLVCFFIIHTFAFAFVHSVQLYAALFLLCLRSSDPSAVRGGDDLPLMAFDPEDDACGILDAKSASGLRD